jgi:acyl-coenzyme A synthetase/AMP-(fatty) acid ligase
MHLYIMHGYTTFILKKFTLDNYFCAIEKNKIEVITMQPWMVAIVTKEKSIADQFDISSLKFAYCSGSPTSKDLCSMFHERFGSQW